MTADGKKMIPLKHIQFVGSERSTSNGANGSSGVRRHLGGDRDDIAIERSKSPNLRLGLQSNNKHANGIGVQLKMGHQHLSTDKLNPSTASTVDRIEHAKKESSDFNHG